MTIDKQGAPERVWLKEEISFTHPNRKPITWRSGPDGSGEDVEYVRADLVRPAEAGALNDLYGVGGQLYTFVHQMRNDLAREPDRPGMTQRAQELLDAIATHDKEVDEIAARVTVEGLRKDFLDRVSQMRDEWDIKAQTMNSLRGWTINTAKANAANEIITALEELSEPCAPAEVGQMVNDVELELERICNRLLVDQDAVPTRIETDYLLSALAQRAPADVDVRAATHDVVKWYSEMLERVPVKEEFEGVEAVLAQHFGTHMSQPVDVRVVVETWAAELADPIPYDTDATGPIPKPVVIPSVDVEDLIDRLTTHAGQPATGRAREEAAEAAAKEIVMWISRATPNADPALEHDPLLIPELVAIITRHSASRGDGGQPNVNGLACLLVNTVRESELNTEAAVKVERLLQNVSTLNDVNAAYQRGVGDGEHMRAWQPIASAPKMRTIILWADTSTVELRNWRMGSGHFTDEGMCLWEGEIVKSYDWQPSYWMSLPEPPAITALEEMERGGTRSV